MNITLKNCDWINQMLCCNGEAAYPLTTAEQVEITTGYDGQGNPITINLQDWIQNVVTSETFNFVTVDSIPLQNRGYDVSSQLRVNQGASHNVYDIWSPAIRAEIDGIPYESDPYYGMVKLDPESFLIDSNTDLVSLNLQYYEVYNHPIANGKVLLGQIKNSYGNSFGSDIWAPVPTMGYILNSTGLVLDLYINNQSISTLTIPLGDLVDAIVTNPSFSLVNDRYELRYEPAGDILTLYNLINPSQSSSVTLNIQHLQFDPDYFSENSAGITFITDNINYTAPNDDTIVVDNVQRTISHNNHVTSTSLVPTIESNTLKVPKFSYDSNGHITYGDLEELPLNKLETSTSTFMLDPIDFVYSDAGRMEGISDETERFVQIEIPTGLATFYVDIWTPDALLTYRFESEYDGVNIFELRSALLCSNHTITPVPTSNSSSSYVTYYDSLFSGTAYDSPWPTRDAIAGVNLAAYQGVASIQCIMAINNGTPYLFIGQFDIQGSDPNEQEISCVADLLGTMDDTQKYLITVRRYDSAETPINVSYVKEFGNITDKTSIKVYNDTDFQQLKVLNSESAPKLDVYQYNPYYISYNSNTNADQYLLDFGKDANADVFLIPMVYANDMNLYLGNNYDTEVYIEITNSNGATYNRTLQELSLKLTNVTKYTVYNIIERDIHLNPDYNDPKTCLTYRVRVFES